MLIDKNKDLISDFRDDIKSTDVKLAFDVLIEGARNHTSLNCHLQYKGVIRDFRFYADEKDQPFSFITNQESLLFYIRPPAIRSKRYLLPSMTDLFGKNASENKASEITIKVFNREQAKLIVFQILDAWKYNSTKQGQPEGPKNRWFVLVFRILLGMLEIIRRELMLYSKDIPRILED